MPKLHFHYKDYLDIRGDGRIVLYKRADHQNPKWTARLKIPETTGFVVKSTKTTDVFEARHFAEELFYRLEGKARRGEPINCPTFRKVFAEWAKVPIMDQVVRTAKYVDGNVRRVEIWALQYFDELTIDRVTESTLADYLDWRLSQAMTFPWCCASRHVGLHPSSAIQFMDSRAYLILKSLGRVGIKIPAGHSAHFTA